MACVKLVGVLVRSGLSEADARAIADANADSVFLVHDAGVLLEDTLSREAKAGKRKREMVRSDVAEYMLLDRAFPDDKAKRDEVGEKLLGFFFGVYEARVSARNDADVWGFVRLCKLYSPAFHLNGHVWKPLEFALLDAKATSKKVRKAMSAMGVFPPEVREELDAVLAAARSRGDVAGLLKHVAGLEEEEREDQLLLTPTPAEAVVASAAPCRSEHTAPSESAPAKTRRVNLFP